MRIKIDTFHDPDTETYAVVSVGFNIDDFQCDGNAEVVLWSIESVKPTALSMKEAADKAAELAKRSPDGSYSPTAFQKAFNVAFAALHCSGYKRNEVTYPALTWDAAKKLTGEGAAEYPILDDTILSEYVLRSTTFLLKVSPRQPGERPANNNQPKSDQSNDMPPAF